MSEVHDNSGAGAGGSPDKGSVGPIKRRVNALERSSRDANKKLNDNKKEVQLLRSECATLEHHATETTNDILKEIIEDIANLEKDFTKLQQVD